jgi:PIN like domain
LKIIADEHVSQKILQTIRLICFRSTLDLSHVLDKHSEGTKDETWLHDFASEGGRALLSGDSNILKRPHQIVAVGRSGLICVILSKQWSQSQLHEQAANLLFWWPRIEAALNASKAGDCWPVPFAFDRSTLTQKTIDYTSAAKAVR